MSVGSSVFWGSCIASDKPDTIFSPSVFACQLCGSCCLMLQLQPLSSSDEYSGTGPNTLRYVKRVVSGIGCLTDNSR